MSYASTDAWGLGKFNPAQGLCPSGLLEGGARYARCMGGEFAQNCDDFCCPSRTWSNVTYKAKLGALSHRYFNENRIRDVLRLVAYPVRGFHNGVMAFAHDNKVKPSAELMLGLIRARHNFEVLLPRDRWYNYARGVPTDCQADGFYSVKRTKPSPISESKIRALDSAMGIKLPASFKSALRKKGEFTFSVSPLPSSVVAWDKKVRSMIARVPGSGGGQPRDAKPTIGELLTVTNGVAVAKPWLAEFLDCFAKGWRKSKFGFRLPKGIILPKAPRDDAGVPPRDDAGGPPPPPKDLAVPWGSYAGVAAVTVAGLGVGVWFLKRK